MRPVTFALLCLSWVSLMACGPAPNLHPETPEPSEIAEAPAGPPEAPSTHSHPSRRGGHFAPGNLYEGKYYCAQGDTGMALRIDQLSRHRVHGVFSFFHEPTNTRGSFLVSGRVHRGEITFHPGEWIEKPAGYVSVPFRLVLIDGGERLSGNVLHNTCGAMEAHLVHR